MARPLHNSKRVTPKTCKEITDLLLAYVSGELSQRRKRAFEEHLQICPDCLSFLHTYRKTIEATGTLPLKEMPVKLRNSIQQFLRRRLRT